MSSFDLVLFLFGLVVGWFVIGPIIGLLILKWLYK